ncbi:MAG: hypothetical protein JSU92_12355 [Deltaproteobacteria bacterium]|nr:MAG: hypothetical protein JSU92_12355 [Deltaproteobacteria bacterium]
MNSLKISGRLFLIFLALGWLTHCGGSIVQVEEGEEDEVMDTIDPIITITEPADGITFEYTVVVRGTVSDPEHSSGIDYVLVNGIVAQGTTDWAISISGLTQGPNTVEATVWDEAGNTDTDKVRAIRIK